MDKAQIANHASKVMIVGANVCFMIAFCTPAWIKNKDGYFTSPSISRAGLWELCTCTEVFNVFKDFVDENGDSLELPTWYTVAQVFAIFSLLGLAAAILLSYLLLTFDKFNIKVVNILILLSLLVAVNSMIISKVVFGAAFFDDENLNPAKLQGSSQEELKIDWGYGLGIVSVVFTLVAVVCAAGQLCTNQARNTGGGVAEGAARGNAAMAYPAPPPNDVANPAMGQY